MDKVRQLIEKWRDERSQITIFLNSEGLKISDVRYLGFKTEESILGKCIIELEDIINEETECKA